MDIGVSLFMEKNDSNSDSFGNENGSFLLPNVTSLTAGMSNGNGNGFVESSDERMDEDICPIKETNSTKEISSSSSAYQQLPHIVTTTFNSETKDTSVPNGDGSDLVTSTTQDCSMSSTDFLGSTVPFSDTNNHSSECLTEEDLPSVPKKMDSPLVGVSSEQSFTTSNDYYGDTSPFTDTNNCSIEAVQVEEEAPKNGIVNHNHESPLPTTNGITSSPSSASLTPRRAKKHYAPGPIPKNLLDQRKTPLHQDKKTVCSDSTDSDDDTDLSSKNKASCKPKPQRKRRRESRADREALLETANPKPSTSFALQRELKRIHNGQANKMNGTGSGKQSTPSTKNRKEVTRKELSSSFSAELPEPRGIKVHKGANTTTTTKTAATTQSKSSKSTPTRTSVKVRTQSPQSNPVNKQELPSQSNTRSRKRKELSSFSEPLLEEEEPNKMDTIPPSAPSISTRSKSKSAIRTRTKSVEQKAVQSQPQKSNPRKRSSQVVNNSSKSSVMDNGHTKSKKLRSNPPPVTTPVQDSSSDLSSPPSSSEGPRRSGRSRKIRDFGDGFVPYF